MPSYKGNSGSNRLYGSAGADTLTGLGGNDTYIVNSLGDVIVETSAANGGIDTIITSVLDSLSMYSLAPWPYVENLTYAGLAASQLTGNSLANILRANSTKTVADTLSGGAGNDTLHGYGGNDSLLGGSGDDYLDGGAGHDVMVGGSGNDTYVIDSPTDLVVETSAGGTDTIRSSTMKDLRSSWAQQIEGLVFTGTTAASLHGNALGNSVTSLSSSNDTLSGYGGNDVLDGGGGADLLAGGTGDDLYKVDATDVVIEVAGQGNDTLQGAVTDLRIEAYASSIENLLFTKTAAGDLQGNELANLISGWTANDTIAGNGGNDWLYGGLGADSLLGGEGDDWLYGGGLSGLSASSPTVADTSADRLIGGAGNDRYLVDGTLDQVVEFTGGGSLDVVTSSVDNSLVRYAHVEALVLQAGAAALVAQGGAGHDVIVGNEGDNYLLGGLGNDTLSGQGNVANALDAQSDVLDAGDGDDLLLAFDYTVSAQPRDVALFGGMGDDIYILGAATGTYAGMDAGGIDTAVLTSSGSIEAIDGIEHVFLAGANPTYDSMARTAIQRVFGVATAGASFTGSLGVARDATGNDLSNGITGNTLDNWLSGGAGNDTITGGSGHDTLIGGLDIDSLVGGTGNDWYEVEAGDQAVELASGGFDVLMSRTFTTPEEFASYANFEGWQYLGDEAVSLNRGTSNTSNDLLIGGNGHDTLNGYGGNDTLEGGAGDDSLLGGTGSDSLSGGEGNDRLDGGIDNDSLDGGDGVDRMSGQLGADTLLGGAGDDLIDGGGDADSLDGGNGDDALSGGNGQDTLLGSDGSDQLNGQENEDVVVGGAGSDVIRGGGAQSTQVPTTSAHGDYLWGDDWLGTGGGEADSFVFDVVLAANLASETFAGSEEFEFVNGAVIGDFEAGLDKLLIAKDFIGNLDIVFDESVEVFEAGETFSANAEIIFVRADLSTPLISSSSSFFDDISTAAVDVVIGDAAESIGVNELKLFVLGDGTSSAVFLYQSADADARVTPDELFLVAIVAGQSSLILSDFQLF